MPGALGGGFGGVARRTMRKTESGDAGELAQPVAATRNSKPGPWRTPRTASGNFEGVLGFGGNGQPQQSQPLQQERVVSGGAVEAAVPQSPWKEKTEGEKPEVFGSGGGPGWGTGQKKWRIAAGLSTRDEKVSIVERQTADTSLNNLTFPSPMKSPRTLSPRLLPPRRCPRGMRKSRASRRLTIPLLRRRKRISAPSSGFTVTLEDKSRVSIPKM
jgi:hypothetical protein